VSMSGLCVRARIRLRSKSESGEDFQQVRGTRAKLLGIALDEGSGVIVVGSICILRVIKETRVDKIIHPGFVCSRLKDD
jgi:hypothetical protein